MTFLLGVDTGGTYTDAVIIDDCDRVVAKAKSLTTRRDLALGVGRAIGSVLQASGAAPGDISLASLSTTLATNALVEGQGGRVALAAIGFDPSDLARHKLPDALKGDPLLMIPGGHGADGEETATLDIDALGDAVADVAGSVTAFAVAARFAVRNPAHEAAARDAIRDATGLPVTCSHELSSQLNGPRRALTAVLNARLIGLIDHLIGATEALLGDLGVKAPLMVVRGDGGLVSAGFARTRPIETILSGPAASIVGARWLTGDTNAIVSDIGGTTTDVAVLHDGRPRLDPDGAKVGGFQTMVEAVAMRTTGLGGDSEVGAPDTGLARRITLGPRRAIPISLLATDWPKEVHAALDMQLNTPSPSETQGRFVFLQHEDPKGLTERERNVYDRLTRAPRPISDVLKTRLDGGALDRLRARGIAAFSAMTPSDATHILNLQSGWDREAAVKAASLLARRRTGRGEALAAGAEALARMIVDRVAELTGDLLLSAALAEDGFDETLHDHPLLGAGLASHAGALRITAGLNTPVIGLGASAATYYGALAETLGTRMILPEHADVANAIGAVAGHVRLTLASQILSPAEGLFRATLGEGVRDFSDLDSALSATEQDLADRVGRQATAAGAADARLTFARDVKTSEVEGRTTFIEATVTATATGRPSVAGHDR